MKKQNLYLNNLRERKYLNMSKTKKQYKNMLRVLYGRKKDGGHRIKNITKRQEKEEAKIREMWEKLSNRCGELYPIVNCFLKDSFYHFYKGE